MPPRDTRVPREEREERRLPRERRLKERFFERNFIIEIFKK